MKFAAGGLRFLSYLRHLSCPLLGLPIEPCHVFRVQVDLPTEFGSRFPLATLRAFWASLLFFGRLGSGLESGSPPSAGSRYRAILLWNGLRNQL